MALFKVTVVTTYTHHGFMEDVDAITIKNKVNNNDTYTDIEWIGAVNNTDTVARQVTKLEQIELTDVSNVTE